MKNTKKILSLVLAVLMFVSVVPTSANGANAYTINGKTVRYTDFSSSPDDCWNYANNIYNKIWGQRFNNGFSDSNNSLRNLSDSQLLLNATNLKNYISHAALGSCLRICNADYLHGTDDRGHSQIIVQKDSNGFTVFEGGLTASPYNREKYYTWSEYCNTNWLGGTYRYIKYIKWPGANAYNSSHSHSYLSHYEADHPHRVYNKCSCGDWYYTGGTQYVSSCSQCNGPTTILYPTNGATYKVASGVGNNIYLDFALSSNNVQIYENCDGHSNSAFVKSQYFKLTHVGDGWYTIVNVGNSKAADVEGANSASGTNVIQYEHHKGGSQKFRFYDAGNGYCYIKSSLGTYLDVQNGDKVNNSNVWAYSFNGSNAQKWKLIKKDVPNTHKHSYILTIKIQPTCTKDGVKNYHCSCGASYTESISATGHREVVDAAVNPTFTSTGLTEGKHCSVCNQILVSQQTIPMLLLTTGYCGKDVEYDFNSSTGLLTISGNGDMSNYSYESSPFYKNENIKTIIIEDGVTSIGFYTFNGCTNLESISIPDTVTKIEGVAFRDCTNLKSIAIPNSVTEIAYGAFSGCTRLTTVNIGKGLTSLNAEAFKGCVNLTKFTVDKNNKKYSADSNGVLFNKSKTVLIKYPPANKATSYKIPSKVTSIGALAFESCKKLTDIIIHDNVTTIGEGAFSGCSNLKDVTIPDSISSISKNTFVGCTSFKEAVIPNKVTEIAYGAFDNCTSLESVQIPESVESIGMGAFAGCEEMKDVYYEGSEKEWGDISISYKNNYLTSAKIHYNFKPCTHKKLTTLKAVAPTCTKDGKTEGKKCKSCGKITVEQEKVEKKGHTYKTASGTKATLKKNGKIVKKCTVCGYSKKTTIYYPKSIKLSATSYTYNGKAKKPAVTVKDSKGKTLKKDTDYTVKYDKGRKAIGKYTVTVTFKGKYSGTKKLSFTIKPATVTLSKVTAGSKQLTANWKNVAAVTGYEVQASTSSKFTSKTTKKVTLKSAKTKKTTIKKLKKGKKYYVKVRAYKTVDGKKIYGGWSKAKSVKIK